MNDKFKIAGIGFLNFIKRLRGALGARLLAGLIAAIASLFFFGWLASEVIEGETKRFDESVREFVHRFAAPALTALMQTATFLGSTAFLTALGAIVSVVFTFGGRKRALPLFVVTMAGAIVLNFALKLSFQRARPEPFFDTLLPASYSFPSGHALFALCFYGVLAWLITARIKNRVGQILVWAAAILLILLIGISRIYLGVHYPSDVLAGYAAAFVWVFSVVFADWYRQRRAFAKTS